MTASSVIVSIVLCLVVLFAVGFLHVAQLCYDRVQTGLYDMLDLGQAGYTIDVGAVDGTLMKTIVLRDVGVSMQNGVPVAHADRIEVSSNLWHIAKTALGLGGAHLDIAVYGMKADVSALALSSQTTGTSQPVKGEREEEGAVQKRTQPSTGSSTGMGFSFSLNIVNASVSVDYQGFETTIDGINASASFGRDLEFEGADINIPEVSANVPQVGNVDVDDMRLSVDSNLVVAASISSAVAADYGSTAYGISAIAEMDDGKLSLAFFVQNAQSSYLGYDAVLESATFNVELDAKDFQNGGISLLGSVSKASVCFKSDSKQDYLSDSNEEEVFSVEVDDAYVSSLVKGKDVDFSLKANAVDMQLQGLRLDVGGFEVNLDASLDFDDLASTSALGSMKMDTADAKGLEDYTIGDFQIQSLEMDFSLQRKNLDTRSKLYMEGTSVNPYVGSFSANVDAGFALSLEGGVSKMSASLSNLSLAAVKDEASLSFDYAAESGVELSFKVSDDVDGTAKASFADDSIETKLYIDGLKPYEYRLLYDRFLSSLGFFNEGTSLDGSIAVSLWLEKGLVENLMTPTFGEATFGKALDELVPRGRVSTNIAVRDIKVQDTLYSGAVSFEASLDGTVLDVGTLAVSTGGFRLSYTGMVDYMQMIPDGTLYLQDAGDGSELARLGFKSIEETMLYNFVFTSPLAKDSSIAGTLDWQDSKAITASAVLESTLFPSGRIPFEVAVVKSPLEIHVRSNGLNLDAELSPQNVLKATGTVDGISVKASDTLSVAVDMGFDVSYDIFMGKLEASVDELAIKVSDILEFGFDLDVSKTRLDIHDVFVKQSGVRTTFDGSIVASYGSLGDLVSLDPNRIEAVIDLSNPLDGTFAKGTAMDGDYYLEARLESFVDIDMTLLGSKGYGFHSYGSVKWGEDDGNGFSFNSQYRGGRLGFYDSKGRVGSLELNDVGLSLDFNEMSLEFSFSFLNTVEKKASEDSTQSGTITLSGRLETLAPSLLSTLAGLDADVGLTLGLSNFKLEDGFGIPDTTVDILYSGGTFTMDGELINGTFDTLAGYVDIHIDKSFLFGLDAKGYVGNEFDLMVSNVFFPIPLVDQFTDLMLLGFSKGYITGDVLIKGPASDPGFYGMLYCQQFEMWLVYIPQQSFVVNNIAIALQNHSITMPQTPYTGYSTLDGRFLSGLVSLSMDVQNLNFGNMEVSIDAQTPLDLWVPIYTETGELEIRGDAVGQFVYGFRNGSAYLNCVTTASNMLVDFKIEDRQSWIYLLVEPVDMDITLTTGRDVEFCYPEKDNSFINFTLNEGETVRVLYQVDPFKMETNGSFSFKTGQVYYFQNDFYIREGTLDLTPRKFGSSIDGISFQLDLSARLRDYDASGDKVEINLILQNATLDNISPRFTSTPNMSETDILALLGQAILPSSTFDQGISVASVASLAAAATDAATRLGIIESNSNYSLSGIVRDSLGLDIFSLRSSILQNIIIDALPGGVSGRSDMSLLSKYLDGTSLFAGMYITAGVFAQTSFRLTADRSGSRNSNVGHFLSNDLMLDMDFSVDWDNPIGTFTIFTNPQELSPFSILDSMGFSVTKRIQF